MTRLHALALALALSLPAAACTRPPPSIVVQAGAGDRTHTLSATGSATIAVVPDCADLTLVVEAEAKRPADALATARKRQDALVGALKGRGVADADLALSQLGVDPVYRSDGQRSVLDGFRAHVTITATTRAFDQVGTLMETAADAGVAEMSTRFWRSDLEAIRAKVRTQALAAAQAKARDTAAALGLTLGRISTVSDASPSFLATNEYFPTSGRSGLGAESQPLTIQVTLAYEI